MGTVARVVVLPQKPSALEVQELTLPDPGPTQVVVKQYASRVCHLQLHQMHRERNSPVLLGHEAAGVILKKGSAVTHAEEGDTVLVTWVPRVARDAIGLPVPATLEVAGGTAESEHVFT
jgi:Zn-dependent alcohol dehydrogenase